MAEKKKSNAGKPRSFKSGEEILELWKEFCNEIVENGYNKAPTQTEFSWWLDRVKHAVDHRTVYLTINKYYPHIKGEWDKIRADVVSQGTMLGKYQPTMSIFALKNWCNWADKVETKNENTDKVVIDFGVMDNGD